MSARIDAAAGRLLGVSRASDTDKGLAKDLRIVLDALTVAQGIAALSQPTPTAKPTGPHPGELDSEFIERHRSAAPPSIADMVPGTTFRMRRNNDSVWHLWCWTGRALMRIGAHVTVQGAIGEMDIDPSTIRDVTPPAGGADAG
ncbi:hypothetical protein DEI99_005205 [Curtobacterium sp. MCLR17_036]|uniref:hypothetical protein n=1 Tax=Curtobacterium sp. MCLR17_036 TaxID=2175620 RepID=UPI000DAAA9F7|nr:hypothetical protein [Curtobacterium sp. MCLR17_036]WIE65937.1 hypothetical protein DEI99_005205 [Curtobacterium sp. MCLR17_036]